MVTTRRATRRFDHVPCPAVRGRVLCEGHFVGAYRRRSSPALRSSTHARHLWSMGSKRGVPLPRQNPLWITMQMAGPPKAVLYAAYDNPHPGLVTSALLQGSTFTFSVEPLHLSYTGTLSADGDTLTGSCTVENQSHALNFRRSIDTQPITIHGLERMLVAVAGKPDAQVAAQIHGTRLTERISTTRLTRLEANIPRPEARQALIAL